MKDESQITETEGTNPKDELYEHYRFVVDPGTELLRIDKYLFNLIRNTSRNKIQQAAKAGCILVNGVRDTRFDRALVVGDDVAVMFSTDLVQPHFLIVNLIAIFLSLGVSIGAVGSIISMRRFLKV